MDTAERKLKVGDHVAFRQTGTNTGQVIALGEGYNGRPTVKVKGTRGSRGATINEVHAERIPGPDEVIVAKDYLDGLLADSEKLSLLEAYGVDNWEGYELAIRGNG